MRRRLLSFFIIVLVAAGATGVWFYAQGRGGTPKFRVVRVEKGSLVATVSATGNLNAVITVQVGSQVSGQIKQLFADFNSQVKNGQLIARIAPDIFGIQRFPVVAGEAAQPCLGGLPARST